MKYKKKIIIKIIEKFFKTKIDNIKKINNSKFIFYLKKKNSIIKICQDDFNYNLFLN